MEDRKIIIDWIQSLNEAAARSEKVKIDKMITKDTRAHIHTCIQKPMHINTHTYMHTETYAHQHT